MDIFEMAQLLKEREQINRSYLEFLRVPSMSLGIYKLSAGSLDKQLPHTEDEIYFIVSGRAQIQVGAEHRPVEPGSIVFVKANLEHRFHSIEEDLTTLVFFAPAEYSQSSR